jgi:hypothetical protein
MAKKRTNQHAWVPSPGASGSAPGAIAKAQVEAKARELIEAVLRPRQVKPPVEGSLANYLTDISLKWHGTTLFFVSVYACPGPNALSPGFEERFARLRPAGAGCFELAFMRHTGQWVPFYEGLTLDECLATIRDDPWFMP